MKKNKFKPIIYQDEQHLFRSKPIPEDIVSKLLPLLQNITENKDISCCPKSYKLMKLISYEPSGEEASSPLQCAHLFGGYFACVSEKEGTERYRRHYRTARSSYNFLCHCILVLEQRKNHTEAYILKGKNDELDYPLWIWNTYNVLCYHCKVYNDYVVAELVCSLLVDYISDFLLKLKADIM